MMLKTRHDIDTANALSPIQIEALRCGEEVNLVDIIAANCGWNPLLINEKMTVHFGDREYEIVRKK